MQINRKNKKTTTQATPTLAPERVGKGGWKKSIHPLRIRAQEARVGLIDSGSFVCNQVNTDEVSRLQENAKSLIRTIDAQGQPAYLVIRGEKGASVRKVRAVGNDCLILEAGTVFSVKCVEPGKAELHRPSAFKKILAGANAVTAVFRRKTGSEEVQGLCLTDPLKCSVNTLIVPSKDGTKCIELETRSCQYNKGKVGSIQTVTRKPLEVAELVRQVK